MARKRFTTEQIIGYLRQAEVMIGRGCTIEEMLREIDVTANTYYRWRKEYGGLGMDQARRLKVPVKHKKKGRLYLNDGSCIRLRPCWPNHVWAYDFVADQLKDGTKIRTLTVIDEYTRECLSLRTSYSLKADDVMDVLTDLFITCGIPDYIRSDNGLS